MVYFHTLVDEPQVELLGIPLVLNVGEHQGVLPGRYSLGDCLGIITHQKNFDARVKMKTYCIINLGHNIGGGNLVVERWQIPIPEDWEAGTYDVVVQKWMRLNARIMRLRI